MLITRWQAQLVPNAEQIKQMFKTEGYTPLFGSLKPGSGSKDLRQPFDQIRILCSGELLVNVTGNKLLLRAGDRITIPANTKYSINNQGSKDCTYYFAHKI